MRQLIVLPLLYLCFAVISLSVISSIAPNLFFLQSLYFLLGTAIFIAVSFIHFTEWKRYHWLPYIAVVIALIVTLSLGIVHKGASRWITIGPINFQPSQIGQPITIITLSCFIGKKSLKKLTNVLQYTFIVGIPCFLTMIEPNLSTSLIFLFFAGMMAVHADIPIKWIVTVLLLGVFLAILGWFFFLQPYQKQRISTFLSPTENQESNYNAEQSMIAVGSGGFFGRGLGHGVQSQLRFLPERQTDFIFASLAEELGFLGSFSVLLLYGALFVFIYFKLVSAKTKFHRALLVGFLSLFSIQVSINIGMNMGLLPITGITLPFLSYGGSSLLSFAFSFGLLQRAIIETSERKAFLIR